MRLSLGARACATTTCCAEPATPSSQLDESFDKRATAPFARFSIDTLIIKTENESIEAIVRRRRILLAGLVARMEDTSLPKCVMFGKLVADTCCVGKQEK